MDFFLELEDLIDRAVEAGVDPGEILSDLKAKVEAMALDRTNQELKRSQT